METLYAALGQFYFAEHLNSPPTFVQVVGWTKGAQGDNCKRRYVYIRNVPIVVIHGYGGGRWEFDADIIKSYATEIKKPVHQPTLSLVSGNAIIIDGAHYLRYQSITLSLKIFDYAIIPKFTIPVIISTPKAIINQMFRNTFPPNPVSKLVSESPVYTIDRQRRLITISESESDSENLDYN